MDFDPVERPLAAFQESVTADQIKAMCRRAFGPAVTVVSAVELGLGAYNNTYRVELGTGPPVVLRVAPAPARQFRIERELMRNEHASVPFLAPIAPLLPRTLAVDFTHEILGRDYLVQTYLEGVPAPDGLPNYPREQWPGFYRQLGSIARTIHTVRGTRFGPVAGPTFGTWSEAVIATLTDTVADLAQAGLDAADVRDLIDLAQLHRAVLDEITTARLLHGDLWTVNVMLADGAPEPTIVGVCDCDRTSWGDPAADWTIFMAARRVGPERDAFWDGYGPPDTSPGAELRAEIYRGRNVTAARLERHRLGHPAEIPPTYDEMRDILLRLRANAPAPSPGPVVPISGVPSG